MTDTSTRTLIILDNIRSAHNVGSIFRSADGAGVAKIYLLGYTPRPTDRFSREQKEIAKTSLGASRIVPWESVEEKEIKDLLLNLKAEGFEIVSIEQAPGAIRLAEFKSTDRTCYIFGNEIDGVAEDRLFMSDKIVHIPMRGQKESLNVSVAAGIVLFKYLEA